MTRLWNHLDHVEYVYAPARRDVFAPSDCRSDNDQVFAFMCVLRDLEIDVLYGRHMLRGVEGVAGWTLD